MKKAMQCKQCRRIVWQTDANKDGFCCFCKPPPVPVARTVKIFKPKSEKKKKD
jgi:hypothetical protein